MLGGYYDGDHCAYVRLHLQELRAIAEENRRARLVRGSHPLRRRLGRLLVVVGSALAGRASRDREATPPHPPASTLIPDTLEAGWVLEGGAASARASEDVAALAWTAGRIREWNALISCADVVRAYIPLEPYGLGYAGLCPCAEHRHSGRRQSRLVVYEAINRWRCLETGESGTALDFVCRMEGVSRQAALTLCLERWPIHASRLRGG